MVDKASELMVSSVSIDSRFGAVDQVNLKIEHGAFRFMRIRNCKMFTASSKNFDKILILSSLEGDV